MKKVVEIELDFEATTVDSQPLFRIVVAPAALPTWCLCLQLIQDSMVESCVFLMQPETNKRIEIKLGDVNQCYSALGGQHLRIEIDYKNLDYAKSFFLKYYRDGVAEVDHIDIDLDDGLGGYLTLEASEFRPAVSSEEARRRLGL